MYQAKSPSGCLRPLVITLIGFIIICVVVVALKDDDDIGIREGGPKTQIEVRKEIIKNAFSAWDGSHRGVTKLIKASMNDPDSYDHVETAYWDKGDHLVVKTTFRGKNSFWRCCEKLDNGKSRP